MKVELSYHEQVALQMARSNSVGAHHSYETILKKLLEVYPDEADLKELVGRLEDGLGVPRGSYLKVSYDKKLS